MVTNQVTLEERIRRIEDCEQIRALVHRYCYLMDNRDLEGCHDLFTPDIVIRSFDGKMNSTG